MAKKTFGKRFVALLATLALLISMVAMVGSFAVSAESSYTPKRAVTFTTSEGIQQSTFMLQDAWKVAGGKEVTVKGYYKVDSITGTKFELMSGAVVATEATDGWVEFAIPYTVPSAAEWKSFGFWEASGTFALADITFEDAEGNVLYDLATDAALPAGTYTGWAQHSIWYILGNYGTCADGSSCTVVIDDVYTPPYNPKRAVTFTTSEGIQQSTFMLQDAWKVAGGKEVTVKGYYKVDSITGTKFELMGGAVVATEATDGWVEFAIPYTVPSAAEWKSFGFWEASGTFALADITFEDAEGNVLYDLATDKDLPAGTYTGWAQHSIWYILGNYGTCADGSSCTVVIDDVYTPPVYTPKRTVTFTTSEGIQQSTFMLQDAWKVAGGKEVTVKGYYKVDSITGTKFELMGGAVVATEATDGWVEFAIPYTVPSAAEWKSFGFWEASGTFALADITFEDAEGNVLYDLATDKDLPADTYTGWAQHSIWYILGNYGTCADGSSCTVVIDEVYEDGTGGTVIPPNIGAVDVPAIPDLLAADSTGYAPNRAFAIISTVDENPKALYAVWGDNYLASNKYYVFANIKVTGFSAFEGAEEAYSYFQLEAGTQEPVLCTWTADTDGWVQLLGADGKPVSFDKLASADDSLVLTFANLNASANLIVGDLIIADAEGNIVYSLANDKSLNMVSDVRYTSSADWQADPYVSTPEGPTLFPVRTKGNAEYVPNVSLTIAPEKGKVGSVAENSIIIRSNAAPFVAGETYTISGKVNVDVTGGYNGHANPRMDFTAHTLGPIGSAYVADTDGWVSLVYSNGEPITFKGTADLDYIKFNLYCTHGSLSLADIVIRDSQGNVVYDMAKDEGLLAATEPITNEGWFDLGEIWRIALYGEEFSSCVVTVNENPVDHTDADYEVPEFEETVEVPSNEVEEEEDVIPPTDGMSILLLAALSVMSAGGAAVLSLKKKEN